MSNESTIRKIQSLLKDSSRFKNVRDRYIAETASPSCDKYGFGFNDDARFRVFETVVGFDIHTGYYGSSGCSTFLSLDSNKQTVEHYFVRALNTHVDAILQTMGDLMLADAKKAESEAQKEIDDLQNMIDSLKEVAP